jgi:hypothetical protein
MNTKTFASWLRQALLALVCASLIAQPALAQTGTKVSALPAAGASTGAELLPCVQGGVTKACTTAQQSAYTLGTAIPALTAAAALNGLEVTNTVQNGLAVKASPAQIANNSISRLLRAAQRGIPPLTNVMATAPTFTESAAGAVSTINGNAVANPRYLFSDTNWYDQIGAGITDTTTGADQSVSYVGAGTRRVGHGTGIRFATDAAAFDMALGGGSAVPFTIYVTDMAAGLSSRARVQAADLTNGVPASGHYYAVTFPDARARIIEIYRGTASGASNMSIRGVNVAATASVWRVRYPDEPRIAIVGDSWCDAGGTANTNPTKLLVPDFFGEVMGAHNVLALCQAGSGFLNPNGSGSTLHGTYAQRIAAGDIDVARIGVRDLIVLPGSINDDVSQNAAWDDATEQAAVTATLLAARAKQPTALIESWGPQFTKNTPTATSRFAAHLAGCNAAAANDNGIICNDNGPAGENWLFGTSTTGNVSTMFGSDGSHMIDFGQAVQGRREGQSTLNAIRTKYGL